MPEAHAMPGAAPPAGPAPRQLRGWLEPVRVHAAVLRCAAAGGMADLRMLYTWRTWVFGWLVRVLAQVAFYGLIGLLLDDPDRVVFLVVGAAVSIAMMEAMLTVASTAWERWQGTLPLLVAAPVHLASVFIGRSVQWLVTGTSSATIAFFVSAPLFGIPLPWPQALAVVPLIALTALTCYAVGCFVGAVVLHFTEARNVVLNAVMHGMIAICGVVVPVAFWPAPVQAVAAVLPLTHGLEAVRAVLAGGDPAGVLAAVGWALLTGVGWLAAAVVVLDRLAQHGRRDGSIEFGG